MWIYASKIKEFPEFISSFLAHFEIIFHLQGFKVLKVGAFLYSLFAGITKCGISSSFQSITSP